VRETRAPHSHLAISTATGVAKYFARSASWIDLPKTALGVVVGVSVQTDADR
jgi:hypothetical protein